MGSSYFGFFLVLHGNGLERSRLAAEKILLGPDCDDELVVDPVRLFGHLLVLERPLQVLIAEYQAVVDLKHESERDETPLEFMVLQDFSKAP